MKDLGSFVGAAGALAVLLSTGGATAQSIVCSPATVFGGEVVHITTPGHTIPFGGGSRPTSYVEYAAGTASGRMTVSSWTPGQIDVAAPSGLSPGPVVVHVIAGGVTVGTSSRAGCFSIVSFAPPPAGIRPAGTIATLAHVATSDWPCSVSATITLTGTNFEPGTEQPPWGSHPAATTAPLASRWRMGATMVELATSNPADGDTYTGEISGLRIASATSMEMTVSQCFVTQAGAKARLWFPDGSKSAWVGLTTPVGGIHLIRRLP